MSSPNPIHLPIELPQPGRDYVSKSEIAEYNDLRAALLAELRPAGAVERVYADEIVSAAWRLRRCATLEAQLACISPGSDPMANPETAALQASIDRARAQANRLFASCSRQLRDLRRAPRPSAVIPETSAIPEPQPEAAHFAKQTQSPADPPPPPVSMPRNAACRCGSGLKFKRCCGPNAPAVLGPPRAIRPIPVFHSQSRTMAN